jgi:antitoxin component YwqK of YwqJK toxin-antitoxin module
MTYQNNKANGIAIVGDTAILCYYVDGLLDGEYIHRNKRYRTHATYVKGKVEGMEKTYHRSSNKISETVNFKNGLAHGLYVEYDTDTGLVISYLLYHEGKIVAGTYPTIDEQGRIISEKEYDINGCFIGYRIYDDNGKTETYRTYKRCP